MSTEQHAMRTLPNIVLVHGAWADGSSWSSVIEHLQADGYRVTAPQFPLTSLADDVARLRHVLALQDRPTVVAGHSYGGQVMTALGLLTQGPPTPALEHQFVDNEGSVWLTEDDFINHFAGDVDPIKAKVLYAVQQPLAANVLSDVLMNVPAWKTLPCWYLVAQDDQALPPDAQRMFANRMGATTVEVPSGHLAMVSHPAEVEELAETAAEAAIAVNAVN
jgi:pimeloyl-ACP methyl ester carboxylesterase